MFTKILISILALLWMLFVVLGFIGLFIWLWRWFRSIVKGDGPPPAPSLGFSASLRTMKI